MLGLRVDCDSTVLGDNPTLTLPSPTCISKAEWGGFICFGVTYRAVYVQSEVAHMTNKKQLGPVRITRYDSTVTLQGDSSDIFYGRTYGSVGAFPDMCPDVMPEGRYRYLVALGYEHEVFFTNSLPDQIVFAFFSNSVQEAILMRLFVINPFALDVYRGTTLVPASTTVRPTVNSTAGANQFNPQSTSAGEA